MKARAGTKAIPGIRHRSGKVTAAAAAAIGFTRTPVYGQNIAPSANVLGANRKLVVGCIGNGGSCECVVFYGFLPMSQSGRWPDVAVKAVCAPSKTQLELAKRLGGPQTRGYEDHRELLEKNPDIDAILCDTPHHLQYRVCLDALNAGKHVYVQPPMTRYLGEAFEVYDTVRKTGKIFQVGAQGASDRKWHKAAEWIRAGRIGRPVMCMGSYMRNNPKGEWNWALQSWGSPEDINWPLWLGNLGGLGGAFNAEAYFRWQKYYRYSAGLLGRLISHKVYSYLLATGNPEFSTRVACLGTRKTETDKRTPGAAMRDVREFVQLIADFPSGLNLSLTSSTVNEFGTQEVIRGERASLLMAGNKVELRPERAFANDAKPEISEAFPSESIEAHFQNFFDAIRGEAQPNAGIELAIRAQTITSLAEMSDRLNVMCCFDERTRTVTDGRGKEIPLLNGDTGVGAS